MGAYATSFVPDEAHTLSPSVKPSSPDWIIAHVTACNVPVLKVQRCWHRFLQMGADRNGLLTPKAKIHSEGDKFMKQVLQLLPKNARGVVTFQVYVNACSWFENADSETKIKVIFFLMNRGNSVDPKLFARVISHLYESMPQPQLQEYAEITVQQIDKKNQGSFDEEDFVKWVLEKPTEDLEKILHFQILPSSPA